MPLTPEVEAQILRYYHAERWRVGTIAPQLHLHRDTVSRVLAQAGLAVLELLNDLCDRIWVHYQLELMRELSEDRITSFDVPETDPPF